MAALISLCCSNQTSSVQPCCFEKPFDQAFLVLVRALNQIAGNAEVKRAVALARHDVDGDELKKWRRAWKLALIERANPQWRDLYDDFSNPPPPTFLKP